MTLHPSVLLARLAPQYRAAIVWATCIAAVVALAWIGHRVAEMPDPYVERRLRHMQEHYPTPECIRRGDSWAVCAYEDKK